MQDETNYEATVEETPVIQDVNEEIIDVAMFEAFQAPTAGDSFNHALLNNREIHDAHPITAITGLREELDSIEALQTIYSDKKGNADYYEWADGNALGENGVGYFVTLKESVRTISICSGDDIFGVVVGEAAFVGGQNNVRNFVGDQDDTSKKDNYGLVATSGVVHVRCESDVGVDSYVTSNRSGIATKTTSGYGYKVVALHKIGDVSYATILLNITADQVDAMGTTIQKLQEDVTDNYNNIVTAINTSYAAYNKAVEIGASNQKMSNEVSSALGKVDQMASDVEDMKNQVSSSVVSSAQAKAIAESAATHATSIKEEINNSLMDHVGLRDKFSQIDQQITDTKDEVTIVTNCINGKYEIIPSWNNEEEWRYQVDVIYYVEDVQLYYYFKDGVWKKSEFAAKSGLPVAVSGLQVKVDEHSASLDSLTSWQDETRIAMTRMEQKADSSGAYIQSTVVNIDKYAVGPHSQAYGFTLRQAKSVLEPGIIYTPTGYVEESYIIDNEPLEWFEDDEYNTKDHNKVYYQTSEMGVKEYQYYDWYKKEWVLASPVDEIPSTSPRTFQRGYLYKWGRIEQSPYEYGWITVDKDYNKLDEINTSAPSVFWTHTGVMVDKDNHENDNYGYWYATPDESGKIYDEYGNETNRYVPYTLYKWDLAYKYQIEDEGGTNKDVEGYHWIAVATLAGNAQNRAVSQLRQDANNIELRVTDTEGSVAAVQLQTNGVGAQVSQIVTAVGENGEVNAASIIAAVNKDESNVIIKGDKVDILGNTTFTSLTDTVDGNTVINGGKIKTGTITSDSLNTDAIKSNNYDAGENLNGINLISRDDYTTPFTDIDSQSGFGFKCIGEQTSAATFGQTKALGLKPKTKYILSFVAWIDTKDVGELQKINCRLIPNTLNWYYTFNISSIPMRFSEVIYSESDAISLANLQFLSEQIDDFGYYVKNTVYITDIKLEEGDEATGWRPALKDETSKDKLIPYDGYSQKGTYLDLTSGNIYSENFNIIKGNVSMIGKIQANEGIIGGFTLDKDCIYYTKQSYNDLNTGVYIGTDGIGLGKGSFYVTDAGYLYASNGKIGNCTITADKLTVPAANITGKLDASQINADGITADSVDLTGTITATSGQIGNWTINSDNRNELLGTTESGITKISSDGLIQLAMAKDGDWIVKGSYWDSLGIKFGLNYKNGSDGVNSTLSSSYLLFEAFKKSASISANGVNYTGADNNKIVISWESIIELYSRMTKLEQRVDNLPGSISPLPSQ